MSEMVAPTPSEATSVRKSRRPRPGSSAITMSVSHRNVWLASLVAALTIVLAFAGGWWSGRRRLSSEGADSAVVAPSRIAAAAPAPTSAAIVHEKAADLPEVAAAPSHVSPSEVAAAVPSLRIHTTLGPAAKGFGVQTGAYPSLKDAEASLESFRSALAAHEIYIVPVEIPGRGTWHRVRIGMYEVKADAEEIKARLPEPLAKSAMVVSYK